MKHRSTIAFALLLGGLSVGSYFLGANSKSGEMRALEDKQKALEARNEELGDLLANQYVMSWETLDRMDPISRKHMIIQIWYSSQDGGNYFLGRDMQHEWGPRWNRRSPILILEEQTKVMTEFLADLRKLEEASPYPPRYPTEEHRDPVDGSRIEWENFIEVGNQADVRTIWYGKSRGREEWMAYEYDKGVYAPDPEFLQRIVDHKKTEEAEEADADPFFHEE